MPQNTPGPSRAFEIQVPCIVFLVTTPTFVGIRLWSRAKSKSGLGWDDWTILASCSFAVIVMAFMLASCTYGFGQHIANITTPNRLMTMKFFFVSQAFYKLTMNTTKMSILMLYLRIFIQRWFRITCYVLLVIITSYMVGAFFASVFQCTPVARAWNKTIPGSCIDITTNWYANAGFSIATDVIILTLPMYPLYKSKIILKRKIALMGVFALGAFVVVTSILRMQTLDFSSTSPDPTYDIASSVWTMLEENVAITCACLPMMWMPLARLFPSFFSLDNGTDSYGTSASRSSDLKATSRPRSNWTHLKAYPDTRARISMNQTSDPPNRPSEDSTGRILPSSRGSEAQAGTTDSALTNHGMAQINCLAQHFVSNSTKFMTVFSSDLSRARITAEEVCRAQVSPSGETPLQPILTQNLREKDYGSMEGRFWKTSPPLPRPRDWVMPESKASMRKRAEKFCDEHLLPLLICDPHDQQNVAIVAHGIILQELWSYFTEIFNPADTKGAPGICDTDMSTVHNKPIWSNTGYMTIRITPNATERTMLPTAMPGFAFVILSIDDKRHLANLHRTRGGVGTAAHDTKQRKIDQFFR
ncbi:Histidine phosphatase superfamily, clade-1 [Penicillium expansum]|uniref:Histidine phosphatase superfamily, clade-1 n=1 Tax=Penicillium expansum TaxID=27334 RepID=A0A0A2JDT9_PENEN|nr:Histidine phosphatase superfamily, clade-1 [Penicillium expansum]KGO53572.1 Histidine phosphatase superfamily, clade-1 [Penicillium expansum]